MRLELSEARVQVSLEAMTVVIECVANCYGMIRKQNKGWTEKTKTK